MTAWSAHAQTQTIQIVNADAVTSANPNGHADSNIHVLFVGNPANVTSGTTQLSGVRNLGLPSGVVLTTGTSKTQFMSQSFLGATLPTPPFPIQFISGANAVLSGTAATTDRIFTVTSYTTGSTTIGSGTSAQVVPTGFFTVSGSTPLVAAPAGGDGFVTGAYSQPLSSLQLSGSTSSTLSGQPANVYEVQTNVGDLSSAVIYFSYKPLTYIRSAPLITGSTAIPFQTVELDVAATTNVDLTAIDQFAIPLQVQMVTSGTVNDTRTYYFSGSTIRADLASMGGPVFNGMYVGPGQAYSLSGSNAPKPGFPSFENYLNSLVTGTNSPTVVGSAAFGAPDTTYAYGVTLPMWYEGAYEMTSAITGSGTSGYTVTLTPSGTANNYVKTGTTGTPYLPGWVPTSIDRITINLASSTFNSTIYGATLDSQSFTVYTSSTGKLQAPVTFSGPFPVTSGASTTVFTSGTLANLATAEMTGLALQMTSGPLSGTAIYNIQSVTDAGTVTLSTPLPSVPASTDSFQVLFQVSGVDPASNTIICPVLGNMDFFAPFGVTFVTGSAATSGTFSSQRTAVAFSGGTITLSVPSGTATLVSPNVGDYFTVQVANSDAVTQIYTNSIYSSPVADYLSALNFGFAGGTEGNSTTDWYNTNSVPPFPQRFPYGAARPNPDDGFYNPWAAYFYMASDAYGFAFSDRISPSPLMTGMPPDQTLLITVLPANQLDAPVVTGSAATNEIVLNWPAVSGAAGYSVAAQPPITGQPVSVASGTGAVVSYTASGLPPGMPYTFFVTATNSTQQSLVLPAYATTTGTSPVVTGPIALQGSFNYTAGANFSPTYEIYMNGQLISGTGSTQPVLQNVPFFFNAGEGSTATVNSYVFDVQDTANNNASVYKAAVQLSASNYVPFNTGTTGTAAYGSFQIQSGTTGAFYGSTMPYTLAMGGLPGTIINVAPTPSPTPDPTSYNTTLGLSLSLTPDVRKGLTPVTVNSTPTPTPTPSPAPLPPPPPAPSVKVQGKTTIHTTKAVTIKGTAVGTKVTVKYKLKSGKQTKKKIGIQANGSWKFKFNPQVKTTVLSFQVENSQGRLSPVRKVKVIDNRK